MLSSVLIALWLFILHLLQELIQTDDNPDRLVNQIREFDMEQKGICNPR